MDHDWVSISIDMWSSDWNDTIVTLLSTAPSDSSLLVQRMMIALPAQPEPVIGRPQQECDGYRCENCGVVLATEKVPTHNDLEELGLVDCGLIATEKVMKS